MEKKLNVLLSDLVVFYHKLQNYHWFVSGHSFFQVHGQLEGLYDSILPQIDSVGELILIEEGIPVSRLSEFLENANIKEGESGFNKDISGIFKGINEDFKYLLNSVKEIKAEADKEENYLVSAEMDEFIASYSKSIWMISQASK